MILRLSSWGTDRRDLFGSGVAQTSVALAALFRRCVHISQNVAGD
jgi:hypothetical protein